MLLVAIYYCRGPPLKTLFSEEGLLLKDVFYYYYKHVLSADLMPCCVCRQDQATLMGPF